MPNLIPNLDAPLVAPTIAPFSPQKSVQWGGAPSFNRTTGDFDVTPTGQVVMLNDVGAFIQWVWKSLITARYRFRIYRYNGVASFGSDFPPLIGQPYNDRVMESVAIRFCREAIQFDSRIRTIPSVTARLQADYMIIGISIVMVTGRELQFQQSWAVK